MSDTGASAATVARAMTELQTVGLIVTRGRGGTYVADDVRRPGDDGQIATAAPHVAAPHAVEVALMQDTTAMGIQATYTFAGHVQAPDYVAEALAIEVGEEVCRRVRERRESASDEPVLIAESWHPAWQSEHIPERLQLTGVPGGLAATERLVGKPYRNLLETIWAEPAPPEVASFYQIQEGSLVIVADHVWLAADGDPIMFGRGWHPPDRKWRYRMERP